jgi:hypothetical protein
MAARLAEQVLNIMEAAHPSKISPALEEVVVMMELVSEFSTL